MSAGIISTFRISKVVRSYFTHIVVFWDLHSLYHYVVWLWHPCERNNIEIYIREVVQIHVTYLKSCKSEKWTLYSSFFLTLYIVTNNFSCWKHWVMLFIYYFSQIKRCSRDNYLLLGVHLWTKYACMSESGSGLSDVSQRLFTIINANRERAAKKLFFIQHKPTLHDFAFFLTYLYSAGN